MVRSVIILSAVVCVASAGQYCCPLGKECVTPSSTACDPDDKDSCKDQDDFPICCPVSKLCTKGGEKCDPPAECSKHEYCCPLGKKCMTASKVSCANDKHACAAMDGYGCCPITKLCVKAGKPCQPSCTDDEGNGKDSSKRNGTDSSRLFTTYGQSLANESRNPSGFAVIPMALIAASVPLAAVVWAAVRRRRTSEANEFEESPFITVEAREAWE